MNKESIITALLAIVALAGQAQKHLPAFQYSNEPAVLKGSIIGNVSQKPDSLRVRYLLKYSSGMGDALRQESAAVDADGHFSLNLPTGTTVDCHVTVGNCRFTCYVVPGQTVSFTLNLGKLKTKGLVKSLTFSGQLADFNHDLVYATEQGFDPETIYLDIEAKRNMGQLANELPEKSEQGYFHYLDSTYQRVNKLIENDRKIGRAYREFAKAVNHYELGAMMPFCGQSIQYEGINTDEEYEAFEARLQQRFDSYMQDDPWANPVLSYVMWGMPETFVTSYVGRPVKLPTDYQQCHLASKFLKQMGAEKLLLTEEQKDSVRTFLPVLGRDVLDYNDRMERELSFVSEQGMSRICTLPDSTKDSDDILSAILKPYRGRPVLLDLWETTCGPCRFAFKEMHEKKKELAGHMHFVSVASENSDLATWQRLIPNYIGDHYRLTKQQLQALHRQIPCDTSGVPVWVLINADGSIHHAFIGWRSLDQMMEELSPVLKSSENNSVEF
ncbi:MAG: TlpA family protein disulfide reductase [Bacteroidaceae bacterium]|nr:TlpA family protein disulfide reductase [Bacteroidaceae bacterium]